MIMKSHSKSTLKKQLPDKMPQTTHVKCFGKLMTEVCKSLYCQNQTIMLNLLTRKEMINDLRAEDLP